MEVEVVAPLPTVDFNFDSSCSSPYITAPSSPQPFSSNLLFSTAPTSPSHHSSFYSELNDVSHVPGSSSTVTSKWEPKQSAPKRKGFNGRAVDKEDQSNDDDFEFNFIGHLERTSLSADELFVGGKIKPLKPPPMFEPTLENRREPPQQQQRGRERKSGFSFSSSYSSSSSYNYNYIHKKSRSLSPYRASDIMLEEQDEFSRTRNPNTKSYVSSILSAISFQKGNKKWKLKDLLLFRSASESRATSIKERLRKYSVLGKKLEAEDVFKNGSFRSSDSVSNVSPASSKRRSPPMSAHELHYKVNRAATEEMRRKTFLPYKQGLLGCLGFNPGMHEISRGVGTLTRG